MKAADESAAFARLVLALRPYLGDLVLIGGWAQRLFRLHPWAQPVEFPPLLTQDVDVAIPKKLSPRAEGLRTLLRTAGFTERFFGEDHPPVTHYQLGDDILYIHDTLLAFGRSLADLERLWIDRVAPGIHRTAARMLRGSPGALFSQTTDPARAASRVATAAGRPVTPEEIAAVCRTGLARVFT